MKILIVEASIDSKFHKKKSLLNLLTPATLVRFSDLDQVWRSYKLYQFDIIILDEPWFGNEEDGLFTSLVRISPQKKIVIHSSELTADCASLYNAAGASAYIHESSSVSHFLKVIQDIQDDCGYFPIINEMNEYYKMSSINYDNSIQVLNSQELKVLHLLFRGARTSEMSAILDVDNNSIDCIKARIYQKLGVQNAIDSFRIAQTYGKKE